MEKLALAIRGDAFAGTLEIALGNTYGNDDMLAAFTARRSAFLVTGLIAVAATAAALAANSKPAAPGDKVGIIQHAQGKVHVERNGLSTNVTNGDPISRRDHLMTGPASRALLAFDDGSRLAVGENAVIVVADYMREEGRRSGALILDLIRGAIRLIAAKPEKSPDKRVEVRTAAATISSQGMDLWSGPVGEQIAVLVIKGKVEVRNDAGLVTLDRKRLGTFVSNRDSAPEKPTVWPANQARQMLHTVALERPQ